MRKTGQAIASLAFGVVSSESLEALPDAIKARLVNGRLPKKEMAKLHAETFQRAAAYGVVRQRLSSALKKVEELEKALSDIKNSGPGGDGSRHIPVSSPKFGPEAWAAELNALAR